MDCRKIILVDTSYPINSRNQRIVDSLKRVFGDGNVKYVCWNRDGRVISIDDFSNYIFCKESALGDKFSKLKNLFFFKRFLRASIKDFNPDVIIASHWDSLIPCASIKRSHQTLIYENLDMPTGSPFVFKILRRIEKKSLRKANAITYASRFYKPYYDWFQGEHMILENKIPESMAQSIEHKTNNKDELVIAFNGGLRYAKIFKNLFDAIRNIEGVHLDIYGGDSGEGALIMKYGEGNKNITFHGPYKYAEVPSLYSKMDIVWGVYPSDDFNVKLAISNKYHESVFYGVPGIFANNTKLGDWVKDNRIGYQVDGYSVESIRNLILYLRDNKYKEISEKRDNMVSLPQAEKATWDIAMTPLINYIISNHPSAK